MFGHTSRVNYFILVLITTSVYIRSAKFIIKKKKKNRSLLTWTNNPKMKE